MLRRRPDNTFEFRYVEAALEAARPAPLSPARRDALRARIFAMLGEQERRQPLIGFTPGERWVTIPAGVGIAAAIFAAVQLARESVPTGHPVRSPLSVQAAGSMEVNGREASEAFAGDRIVARGDTWLTVAASYRVGLETGTAVRFEESGDSVALYFERGRATVATANSGLTVYGSNWSAMVAPGSVATFASVRGATVVTVAEGLVTITTSDGSSHEVRPPDGHFFVPGEPGAATPEPGSGDLNSVTGTPGQAPTGGALPDDGTSPGSNPPGGGAGAPAADDGDDTGAAPPTSGSPPSGGSASAGDPERGTPPEDPGAGDGGVTENPGGGSPPADPPGAGSPPADPGSGSPPADPPGKGTPPENPPGNPNPGGSGSPPADPPGNGTPPSNPGGGSSSGDHGSSASAPGHTTGGVTAASPGSGSLTVVGSPGKSAGAAGHDGDASSGDSPGKSADAAGHETAASSGASPGKSADAPGHETDASSEDSPGKSGAAKKSSSAAGK
jgi:hypothetical protein